MKKAVVFILLLASLSGPAFAFSLLDFPAPIGGGDRLTDFGVSMGAYKSDDWSYKLAPLFMATEYCLPIRIPLSIGFMFNYEQYGFDYPGDAIVPPFGYNVTYASFMGRLNWHWNINQPAFDLYTGGYFGYTYFAHFFNYRGSDIHIDFNDRGGLIWGGQLGMHVFVNSFAGLVFEFCYPFDFRLGLTFKLNPRPQS